MKYLLLLLIVLSVMFSGCDTGGVVTANSANLIPYGGPISANSDYVNIFYIEQNTYFGMDVFYGQATINNVDMIRFKTGYASSVMEYVVILSVGDLAIGDTVKIKYGFNTYIYEVE